MENLTDLSELKMLSRNENKRINDTANPDSELLSSPKQKRARFEVVSDDTERQAVEVKLSPGEEENTDINEAGEKPAEEESENPVENLGPEAASVEPQVLPPINYEYLDHTADVQIHAWGESITEAFEQCAMGMFAYMTDIERVDNLGSEQIEATGHDMLSLLYGFLDEWLFVFNAEPNFVARKINITSFDRENFKIRAIGYGETFDLSKHTQGTEVKAITYSNMQFHENDGYAEVFVIIDI